MPPRRRIQPNSAIKTVIVVIVHLHTKLARAGGSLSDVSKLPPADSYLWLLREQEGYQFNLGHAPLANMFFKLLI